MKIKAIDIYQFGLKIPQSGYSYSGGHLTENTSVIVRLMSDAGHIGWGETCPLGSTYQAEFADGVIAALSLIAPHLIGQDILPQQLMRQMDCHLMGHNYAKAAIDIASYDALGHKLSLPVSDLLGGAIRDRIPSYYAIGFTSPKEASRIAIDKQNQGFERLQIKAGGRDIETDIETVRTVWKAINPTMRIAVDANRGWTVGDALHFSQACHDIPVVMEQPCRTISETHNLKGRLNHPLYLDESIIDIATAMDAMGHGICDGFGMKMTRIGGISNFLTMRQICAAKTYAAKL